MKSIFSTALSELDQASEMTPETWKKIREAMRRMLVSELKRRGLWESSPRFLGIVGHGRWSDGQAGDAIDELADAMLIHVFVDRLTHLIACFESERRGAAAESKRGRQGGVQSLVWRFIRQHIYETHRREDRPGHGVYVVLAAAVERLAERRELFWRDVVPDRERARPRLGASTTFSFFEDLAVALSDDALLTANVVAWEDGSRLADWLAWTGESKRALVESTTRDILLLRLDGVQAFRFQQILDPLRAHIRALVGHSEPFQVARSRTWAQWVVANDESIWVWLIDPDPDPDRRAHLEALSRCVERRFQGDPGNSTKERDYLLRLWRHLRTWQLATSEGDLEATSDPVGASLSYRALSEQLDIPRDRIRPLLTRLQGQVADCEQRLTGASLDTLSGRMSPSPEKNRDRHSREQVEARFQALRGRSTAWTNACPERQGDLLGLDVGSSHGILWLWRSLSRPAGSARVRLVPVDSFEPNWPGDLDVGHIGELGRLTVRRGFFVDVERELAIRGRLLARLPTKTWRLVDERSLDGDTTRRATSGVGVPGGVADELDPDRAEWAEILAEACRELAGQKLVVAPFPSRVSADPAEPFAEVAESRGGGDGWGWRASAIAASILLTLTLGVFFWRERAHDQRDQELRRELVESRERVADFESERERWRQERTKLAAAVDEIRRESMRLLTEQETELTARIDQLDARLRDLVQPRLAVPWKKLDLTRSRTIGDDPLLVPDSARAVHLLLSNVRQGDVVEIWTGVFDVRGHLTNASVRVWRGRVEQPQKVESRDGTDRLEVQYEQLIRIPTSLLPPGDYVIRHQSGDGKPDDYLLTVVRPSSPDP